ncbi:MAG: M23 family metallopeptidase [Mariprofundaceae bacterium]|nr:M23 family metallopeptidase [Mariprofundaceae bacterium]
MGVLTLACVRYDYHGRGIHQPKSGKTAASAYKKPIKGTYIVRKGDTLYNIGQRFDLAYRQLAKKNHIGSDYTIFVGQRLYLKGIAPAASAAAVHYAKKPNIAAEKRPQTKPSAQKTSPIKHPVASSSKVKLSWPVKGKVTSRFGPRNNRMHDGIDVGANEGVSIHAAAAGEVVYADSRLSGYGNLIIVRHSSDMFTAYAHNKVNLVKRGDKVKSGQRIAYVGSTGRASGPHLHFEVRRGETAVDPLAYLPKR